MYLELIEYDFSNLNNPNSISIEVDFDLLTLNNWENGDTFTFYVNQNSTSYFDQNFIFNNGSYCNFSVSTETIRLYHFNQTIPYTNNLNLYFRAEFHSYKSSQSMVIQNLELYLNSDCDSSCLTCDGDGNYQCTNCPYNSTMVDNQCVCPEGWYMSTDYAHCVECDITCEACNGPSNCTSCFDNLGNLSNGTCIPNPSFLLFFSLNFFIFSFRPYLIPFRV